MCKIMVICLGNYRPHRDVNFIGLIRNPRKAIK